jgi:hypothetical protein
VATPPLSESQLRQALDAYAEHGTHTRAAAALRIPRQTFQARLDRAQRWAKGAGYVSAEQAPAAPIQTEAITVSGDNAELMKVTTARVKSLADLIRVCEINTDEWEVVSWKCGTYEGQSKDNVTSAVTVTQMFTVRASLTRKWQVIDARAEIAAMLEDAARRMPPRPFVARATKGAHMLELMIPDLHLGKLAWAPETGYQHYDSKIAVDVFRTAVEVLVARTAAFAFERVVFPVGNDMFHSDTKQGTTTKGTPLDNDGRFQKMFITGRQMIAETIDRLRQVAHVEVVMVPGNHDAVANFCLGDALACWFRNTKGVTIRNAPMPRKYVQFGRNMLLFAHGDKGKRTDWPLLMATEEPKMFGACLHRETHTGHLHKTQVDERMGVRVRTFSALCSADSWHSENLFVGNARQADALVWHRDEGIVSTAVYTAPA